MKQLLIIMAVLFTSSCLYGADLKLSLTIPDAKQARVRDTLFKKYPLPSECPPPSPTSTPCSLTPSGHLKDVLIEIFKKEIQEIDNSEARKAGNTAKHDAIQQNRKTDYGDLMQ